VIMLGMLAALSPAWALYGDAGPGFDVGSAKPLAEKGGLAQRKTGFRLGPKSQPDACVVAAGHTRGARVLVRSPPECDSAESLFVTREAKDGTFRLALASDLAWSLNHGVYTKQPGDVSDAVLRASPVQMYNDEWINSQFKKVGCMADARDEEYCMLEPSHAPGWHLAAEEGRVWLRKGTGDDAMWRFDAAPLPPFVAAAAAAAGSSSCPAVALERLDKAVGAGLCDAQQCDPEIGWTLCRHPTDCRAAVVRRWGEEAGDVFASNCNKGAAFLVAVVLAALLACCCCCGTGVCIGRRHERMRRVDEEHAALKVRDAAVSATAFMKPVDPPAVVHA